ncbi:ABC transporter permease [Algicola sagamiensis]|uniref:ABC transporter permease n=1 Tax=Algicola sagamiensis TaxID=163869 RepID=UPI000360F8B3|nr:ABC transporter permease [Algicola sagamiensis]
MKQGISILQFGRNNVLVSIAISFIFVLMLLAYAGPFMMSLAPYETSKSLLNSPTFFSKHSSFHLGTDDLGRDIQSRLIYGARSSLSIGLAVVLIALSIGTTLGLIAGVYGGWVDRVIVRCNDILMSLPSTLLAIVVVAVMGGGLTNAMFAVTIVMIPRFIRVIRAVAKQEVKKQYVQAAYTFGYSKFRIMWCEVLPNCWAPMIVQATLGLSDAILDIAALGFLGLGAKPPTAEWGAMLSDARQFIETAPYLAIMPGLCIFLTVLSFNLLGDYLRDLLDPKMKRK